ncbi:alpha/beta fold hydrolase [Saccharibacillus kuerlensis]|nr:alpha/beta fold hydrolase [Saccharibacillus kuerlensis]
MRRRQPRRKGRLFLVILLVLFLVLAVSAVLYVSTPYGPSAEAEAALNDGNAVSVTQTKDWIEFEPTAADGKTQPGIIFYPGGRVEPEAYSVWARDLAETGRHVFIVKMPFNFAFFGQNKAQEVLDQHSDEAFVIGGHSLGGPFAARYAAEHPQKIAGVFFLASYAEGKGDLSGTELPTLSITASEDKVLNRESYEKGRNYLPGNTEYKIIEGGNHGQFGSYGEQGGDGKALISEAEQRQEMVGLIQAWLDGISVEVP